MVTNATTGRCPVSNGVAYPARPMQPQASLWRGESWVPDRGRTKRDWSYAPLRAQFGGFDIDGCVFNNISNCGSSDYWWNGEKYWELDMNQHAEYEVVRKKYMTYDYCSDQMRYPVPPPECPQ